MKKSSHPTQTSASTIAPRTVATGAKGCGSERAAGSAAMQYEKVPRKIPSVHCVTRSLEKLTMMRGENCIDARVSVISRMANTMDTTVMMEAAIPARMTWATWASACVGNRTVGTQALAAGNSSSDNDRNAPAQPSASAIVSGRIKKPPRRLYIAWRNINGRLLLTALSVQVYRIVAARTKKQSHEMANAIATPISAYSILISSLRLPYALTSTLSAGSMQGRGELRIDPGQLGTNAFSGELNTVQEATAMSGGFIKNICRASKNTIAVSLLVSFTPWVILA